MKNYIEIAKNVFDIEAQGLNFVSSNITSDFEKIIEAVIHAQGRFVVTGMGKSGLVGKKISATLASTGTRSFFMHPAEAYHGDLGMIHSGDIILAISNSGETDEIIKLLPFFKDNGNKVIAMSAKKDSTLAKHTDYFLNIAVNKEACPLELAPTTSTTVTMAMGDALAVALMEARNFKAENFARFHPGGSLGRKLLTTVADKMRTKDLPILSTADSFEDTISIISNGRLGLGVLVKHDKVIGIITDGDIRRLLKVKGAEALKMKAGEFGLKEPYQISSSLKIVEAERIMNDKKVTALVVTNNGILEGILHLYNL